MNEDVEVLRSYSQLAMFLAVMCLIEVISRKTEGVAKLVLGIASAVLALLAICGTCWADSIEEARMKDDIRNKEEFKDETR
jgi:thymidine kinase